MAVAFTNNWKNILDKLRSILRTEFKGALPVYIGDEGSEGSQFLRLAPIASEFIEYMHSSESREYTVSVFFVFAEKNIKKTALDYVLRYVSRIEALIHDNITITLADSTQAVNVTLGELDFNVEVDGYEDYLVAEWNLSCTHFGNPA